MRQHGPLADAPIALSEVQGYAYEAALGAADLLDHVGRPGGQRLRAFAARLRQVFQASFRLDDDRGRYIAIGLDGAKRAITAVSSNPGHLLGTGLLDPAQERVVADRLVDELSCVGGLRTLSEASVRYNPLSYHNGSVWPHDTAICARGMVLAGPPITSPRCSPAWSGPPTCSDRAGPSSTACWPTAASSPTRPPVGHRRGWPHRPACWRGRSPR